MQLSFLCKSYTASTAALDITETEATVTFLGRQSLVKQQGAPRHQSGEMLTFMGRRYVR